MSVNKSKNMKPDLFQAPDYYQIDDLLTEEHKLVREAAREWVKRDVSPIIEEYAQNAKFPKQIIKGLADIGAFGPYIPEEYGGAGLDQISYGLIMQEIERGDSGVRSTASVQSSLVMYPIWKYGNEAQRNKFLPKLASGEWMGCFGLTEPDHGSNPGGMTTNFKDMGDHYLLNGAKMWISNAPLAQVAVVWAKNEEGRIHGLIVERGMEGFERGRNLDKMGQKAQDTAELFFSNVKIPKDNVLGEPGKGFLYLMHGLAEERLQGAVGFIAGARLAFNITREFCMERKMFGKTLAHMQNTQFKMAEMDMEIDMAQTYVDHCVDLLNADQLTPEIGAKVKCLTSEIEWKMIDLGVQLHGGAGYMREYPICEMFTDARVNRIYAGTSEVMKLIVGREIFSDGYSSILD